MTDFFNLGTKEWDLEEGLNSIQPISDDYSTDGQLDEYARIDHQHSLSNTLRNKIDHKYTTIPNVADTAGNDRGKFYGVSFHEASIPGANVPSTVAAGILLTIVLPNCPIAGAVADISFSALWLCQVAPANALNLQIRVNGVLVSPLYYTQNNANTQSGGGTERRTFAMPIGVNTIDLVEYGAAATYAILGAGNTGLTVVLYR